MSILRRKGKKAKRRGADDGRAAFVDKELLSSDIETLLKAFHEEAMTTTVSTRA